MPSVFRLIAPVLALSISTACGGTKYDECQGRSRSGCDECCSRFGHNGFTGWSENAHTGVPSCTCYGQGDPDAEGVGTRSLGFTIDGREVVDNDPVHQYLSRSNVGDLEHHSVWTTGDDRIHIDVFPQGPGTYDCSGPHLILYGGARHDRVEVSCTITLTEATESTIVGTFSSTQTQDGTTIVITDGQINITDAAVRR